jgi:hypothetical protein
MEMHPPKSRLEDLIARVGAENCKAYARVVRGRSLSYLEARQLDPESILILDLTIREGWWVEDHDHSSWLFIGDDGCGNHYFVDARDNPATVKLLSHDPPGIENPDISLEEFVSIVEVQDADLPEAEGLLTISRADAPRRSILDPIDLEEWIAVAMRHPEIEVTGHRRGLNPFTKEAITFPARGGAYVDWGESKIFAHLHAGSIVFVDPPKDFEPFARKLAESLRAKLFPRRRSRV